MFEDTRNSPVETKYYYCETRYYNPEWCRWISPDPTRYIDFESFNGMNLYCYCGNNPVSRIDKNGFSWKSFWQDVGNWLKNTFGFSVNHGSEETLMFDYNFLYQIESGVGYSKSFDTGKPVNFYLNLPEKWWEFWEVSYGIDININGYGAGLGFGNEQSLSIHMGHNSVDIYENSLGRIGLKLVTEDSFGNYSYLKYEINMPEIVAVAAVIYYFGGVLVDAFSKTGLPTPIPVSVI